MQYKKHTKGSSIGYVLEALIPFTDANLKLAFRPNAFFNELEKRGHMNAASARSAYYEAKRRKLITFEERIPRLSEQALSLLAINPPTALSSDKRCMVIFDIPEEYANKRRQLRTLLKELKFTQEQRSVWVSSVDHSPIVLELIRELSLQPYAKMYLASAITS